MIVKTTAYSLKIVVLVLLALLWCSPELGHLHAQDSTAAKSAEKVAKKAEKEGSKIGKFLKKLFHTSDSAKRARQYIREQQREARSDPNYRYKIDHDSLGSDIGPYFEEATFDLKFEVLGWYPHWEKDYYKSINYSLLSTVAFYSYELDPKTGNPTTVYDWETSGLIDYVKKDGDERTMLLTVTNYGNANNREFLKNDKAQYNFIENLKTQLDTRGADGVCIDFEGIPKAQRDRLTRFMMLLDQELKKVNEKYLIYMTVPAVNWQKSINPKELNEAVDRFAIMGDNFYGRYSKVAGPVSPLASGEQWEPYNLTTSVDYYLKEGVPADKLILALPYYGTIWETRNSDLGSKVKKYIGTRTYDYIQTSINAPVQYDPISFSARYSYVLEDDGKTVFRQCWFDNDSTLSVKLNYIKDKKLAGMGIWALGYDKGHSELWKTISTSMTTTKTYPVAGLDHGSDPAAGGEPGDDENGGGEAGPNPKESKDPLAEEKTEESKGILAKLTDIDALLEQITNYKTVLLFIMALVVLYGGLGMLVAMFQPNTRTFFFSSTAYTLYYTAFVLLFLVVALRWKNIINDTSIALILGFVAGGLSVWGATKIIQKIHRNMP